MKNLRTLLGKARKKSFRILLGKEIYDKFYGNSNEIAERFKQNRNDGSDISTTVAQINKIFSKMFLENILVTIVIPVYNVENYLRECLNSVIRQTHRNLQIICVNDGSTDSSLEILQEYAAKDERILIIVQDNRGAAAARNAAAVHIKGKYTLFVDSDDVIDAVLIEKTITKAELENADIVQFFAVSMLETTDCDRRYRNFFDGISSQNKVSNEEKKELIGILSVWNRLYLSDFVVKNNIYFPEGVMFEDNFFTWKAVILASKIAVVKERFYHVRERDDSIMRRAWDKRIFDVIEVWKQIGDFIASNNLNEWEDYYKVVRIRIMEMFYLWCPVDLQTEYSRRVKESDEYIKSLFTRN